MRLSKRLGLASLLALFSVMANAEHSSDLSKILQSPVLRVGAIEAPPWYHQSLGSDEWVGVVPETIKWLVKGQKIQVEYVPTDWGTAVAGLQSSKFDVVGAFSKTPDRSKAVDFTDAFGTIPTGFVTSNRSFTSLKQWSDLDKPSVRISAVDGSASWKSVADLLPHATTTLVKTSEGMLLELNSGHTDLAISGLPTLADYLEKTKQAKLVEPLPTRGADTPFALRKSSDALRGWMNERIKMGIADGSLTKIWDSYASK